MNTCATCKYWGWDDSALDDPQNGRDCQLFSDWPKFDGEHPLGGTSVEAKARVEPFAGADGGTFRTQPDFGCNQWEAVEQEKSV